VKTPHKGNAANAASRAAALVKSNHNSGAASAHRQIVLRLFGFGTQDSIRCPIPRRAQPDPRLLDVALSRGTAARTQIQIRGR
jgi:hypothetical protein